MGLYLRKSFRAGPVRLNLSKSGLGVSMGVTGARVGVGPRGAYVHAGRGGLYYRQQLSSRDRTTRAAGGGGGLGTALLILIGLVLVVSAIGWLSDHPLVFEGGIAVVAVGFTGNWLLKLRRKRALSRYKGLLDAAFVAANSPPEESALGPLEVAQRALPKGKSYKQRIEKIEADVYQAVLDKVLDDGAVSGTEAAVITAAEKTLRLSSEMRARTKKEVFAAAYLAAIEDRRITDIELEDLNSVVAGLRIPPAEIAHELATVREIVEAQKLSLPLTPVPADELSVRIPRTEIPYFQGHGTVLSRRKSKQSSSGYEYVPARDGTLVLTDKRIMVIGEGTTNIRYADVADIEVHLDEGLLEITKSTSSQPVFLKLERPVYAAKIIDLQAGVHTKGGTQ